MVSAPTTARTLTPRMLLVAAAFYVVMLGATLPTPLYPTYERLFGFGELVTTVVFAVYAIGVTAALVLLGHWSDQVGRRPMLLAGLALSALSAVAFLLPGALGWLFVGRVLSGFSAGIFTGTATAAIVDLAPAEGQGRAGLLAAAVNMAGLGSGPVLAGLLVEYGPDPTHLSFVVDLGLVLLGTVAVLLVPDPVTRQPRPQLAPRALHVPAAIRAVFTRAAIAGFAGFAVLGLFMAVSPAFLGTVLHHHNVALVGALVGVLFAACIAGQLSTTRLGPDRALLTGCIGLILGMVAVAASLALTSLPMLLLGAVVSGLGLGLSFRAGLGAVAAASPEELRGEITSTYFVALYVAIAIPVIGEGALASAAGLVTAGVVFAGVVAVLAGTALVLLWRAGP